MLVLISAGHTVGVRLKVEIVQGNIYEVKNQFGHQCFKINMNGVQLHLTCRIITILLMNFEVS
jgi:hypothetical protein